MKNNKGCQRFNSSKKKKKKKKQNPLLLDSSKRTEPDAVAAPVVPASSSATATAPAATPAPALASVVTTTNPTPVPLSARRAPRIMSCFHGHDPVSFITNIRYWNACTDLSDRVAEAIKNMLRSAATATATTTATTATTTTMSNNNNNNAFKYPNIYYSTCISDVIQNFFDADSTLDLKHLLDTMVYKNTEMLLMNLSDADAGDSDMDMDMDSSSNPDKRALALEAVRFDAKIILQLEFRMALMDPSTYTTDPDLACLVVSLHQDLVRISDCDQEVIRFYDKRIPCNCLKPLLATASTDDRGACELSTCSVKAGGDGGRSLFLCAGCHSIKYCSKECQRKDWADHKTTCRSWQELRNQVEAMQFDASEA